MSKRSDDKAAQSARDADLKSVLSTPAGQRLVWRLLAVTGVFGDDFDTDARLHARNAGRRSVGLDLMREAQRVAPQSYLDMANERISSEMRALDEVRQRSEKTDADELSHD